MTLGVRDTCPPASNSGIEDWFGVRLALSGDGNTLAVSAPNEDGGAKGANPPSPGGFGGTSGAQADNSVTDSGAVYLFGY